MEELLSANYAEAIYETAYQEQIKTIKNRFGKK